MYLQNEQLAEVWLVWHLDFLKTLNTASWNSAFKTNSVLSYREVPRSEQWNIKIYQIFKIKTYTHQEMVNTHQGQLVVQRVGMKYGLWVYIPH